MSNRQDRTVGGIMASKDTGFSRKLTEGVGGIENIVSTGCCITRLRLVLKDESRADDEAVKQIDGVKGIIKRGGQYQVVIGMGVSEFLKDLQKFIAENSDGL